MDWTPFTRLDYHRRGQHYTNDLTDAEYALILPYRPARPPAPDGPASGGGWRFLRASERLLLGQPAEGLSSTGTAQPGCWCN